MHSDTSPPITLKSGLPRALLMVILAVAAAFSVRLLGTEAHPVSTQHCIAVGIFILVIAATLLFWNLRLAIAFIGIAIMLGSNLMSLPEMLEKTELHIILFLVGMMTIVGVLKDLGLFTWIIQAIISAKNMTGLKFTVILVLLSGIMPGLVDEVTSIVFVLALVFQVCDTLKIRPTPFVLIAVMATNIGSTGTMLGNPVGILIGSKAQLTFGDFLVHATPIMLLTLVITLGLLLWWYRKDIHVLDERLRQRRAEHRDLAPLVEIPHVKGLLIMLGSLLFIAMHHPIEQALGITQNTMLIVAPLTIAGVLMIYRNRRARHYIEVEVEWWTLLFFMMLFAVAGSLEVTGITEIIAARFQDAFGSNKYVLTPLIVGSSAIGSAFVDNIVFVAAFTPIVRALQEADPELSILWWAMLFGSCFGGNITVIGSTANIVAVGMLEKRYGKGVGFLEWLKIGAIVGLVTCAVATALLLALFAFKPVVSDQKPVVSDQWSVVSESDRPAAYQGEPGRRGIVASNDVERARANSATDFPYENIPKR